MKSKIYEFQDSNKGVTSKQKAHYFELAVIIFLSALLLWLGTGSAGAQTVGCQAGFTYTVNGSTAAFTNTSQGSLQPNYLWNFGDGSYSNLTNPVHTYTMNGTYQVCLTLWDSSSMNCQSTYCAYVVITNSTNPPCNVSFTWSPDSAPQGMVHFYGQSSSLPAGWFWTFGDGNTSTLQNPNHVYANPGTYWACLEIKTQNGDSCTYCDTVYVGPNLPNNCIAGWTNLTSGMTSNFTNTSTGGTPSTGYYWDFGDGSNGTGLNVTHTYSFSGTYTVCLTMYDQMSNCYDTYCDTVNIITGPPPPCAANFYAYPDSNMMSGTFQFVDMSGGSPVSWFWDFGDGGTSTQQNPVHTYTAQGTYWVCLSITTANGDTCTSCDTVQYKLTTTTGILAQTGIAVSSLSNYPNPFSSSTTIQFSLNEKSEVAISVYNNIGIKVAEINNTQREAGAHSITWNAETLSDGIYLLEVKAGNSIMTRKLVLIR